MSPSRTTGQSESPVLSIVVPAFNEERRLPESLARIADYLLKKTPPLPAEVLVVDDGSLDSTSLVAKDSGRKLGLELRTLRLVPNQGKGCAVRHGVLAARGQWILVTDADLSTPVEEWEKLFAAKTPVAIGSRAVDESLVKKKQGVFRRAMGKLFNRLVQLLAVPGIRDTQCGFKLFERDAARQVFQRTRINRFAYDVEALLIARRLGFTVTEIPVLWFNSEDTRVSFVAGVQAYLDVLRIRWLVARSFRRPRPPADE